MLSVGILVNGKYEVTGIIGHGGMSDVYKAYDRTNGRTLAIKESRKNGSQDNQTMELGLTTEANILKNLNSPHLPKIYDVLEDSTQIMIVMDYVEGLSLDKLLEQQGAVPYEKVISWSIQVCEVLHYLHTQNPPIIYRDLKPANIILQPDGNIMLIDFGTARTWKNSFGRTSDTVLIGTEGFAAPEQFGGQGQSDARTDVFCLGATMFNLITNHSPYLKPFGITPLGDWDPSLKDCALDKIIRKCTERDPYARFQTASELREALIAAASNNGKTGLLGLFSRNTVKKTKGWQAPIMQAQTDIKQEVPEQVKVKEPQKADHYGCMVPAAENKAPVKKYQEQSVGESRNIFTKGSAETAFIQGSSEDMDSTWKVLMIAALALGLVLLILAIVLAFAVPVGGIIMIVLALAVIGFGIFCLLKYTYIRG